MITILEYILGGILAALAVALIVLIGKQQSERHGLGSSIAGTGASESYLARNKIGNKKKNLQKWTLVTAIVFVVLVLALYVVGTVDTEDTTSGTSSDTSVTETSAE